MASDRDSARRRSTLRASATVLVTVLAIAALGGAGYWAYVTQRGQTLQRRTHRNLAALARQLESRIDGLREQVWGRTLQPEFFRKGCAQLGGLTQLRCEGLINDLPPADPVAHRLVRLDDPATIRLYFRRFASGTRLYLCARPELAGELRAAPSTGFCASTSLRHRLADLPVERFGFDALVLGTGDGTVLEQDGPLGIPLTGLQQGLEDALRAAAPPREAAAGAATSTTDAGAVASLGALLPASLGGEGYLIAGSPLGGIPIGEWTAAGTAAPSGSLWLFGLVEERRFRDEEWRLPYWSVVLVLIALLLVALAWPLLKLWFLAPQERLRALDVRLLGLSLLIMVAALTAVASVLDAHWRRSDEQDRQLAAVAADVEERLRTEMRDTAEQLAVFRAALDDGLRCSAEAPEPLCSLAPPPRYPACLCSAAGRDVAGVTCCAEPQRIVTRHLNNVLAINEWGYPACWYLPTPGTQGQWRVEHSPLTDLPLGDRDYFKDAQRRNLWRVDAAPGGAGPPLEVAVELVRSKMSARHDLVMAEPLIDRAYPPAPVVAVSTNLKPFLEPVLPLGFGFAVIDPRSEVKLHSDSARNLTESVFDEVDEERQLRGAMWSGRRAHTLDLTYGAGEARAHLAPVQRDGETIPWFILTFRDANILRTLNTETLFGSLVLCGAYLLAFVALLLLIQVVDEAYRAEWLWPERRPGAVVAYWVLSAAVLVQGAATLAVIERHGAGACPLLLPAGAALILAGARLALGSGGVGRRAAWLLALAAAAGLVLTSPLETLWFPLLVAVLWGLVAAALRARRRDAADATVPEMRMRAAHATLLTSLLVGLAVVPAAALSRDAAQHVDGSVRRVIDRQHDFQLRERQRRINLARGRDPIWVLEERANDHSDVYRLPDDGPPPDEPLHESGRPLLAATVRGWLPEFNELSARLHGLGVAHAAAGSLRGWLRLVADMLFIGVLLVPLVWAIGRVVFLLDVDAPGTGQSGDTIATPGLARWRLVRHGSGAGWSGAVVLDLEHTRGDLSTWWAKHQGDGGRLEVRHLERGLEDGRATQVLELLEAAVHDAGGRHIVVESDIDPVRWATDGAAAPRAGDAPPAGTSELMARWLSLLGQFGIDRIDVAPGAAVPADAGARDDEGEARHWQLWRRLSQPEQLALRQLAEEGFLNPNNRDVVRTLFRRGLVRRERAFVLATPSFHRFVLRAVPAQTVATWEHAGVEGGWERLRTYLSAALALGAVFLFVTQPDLFNRAVLTAGGVTGGVLTLLKLLSLFGEERSTTKSA